MTRQEIENLARECDIDDLGAVRADHVPADTGALRTRLENVPPGLEYLFRGLERRLDPALVLDGVRSVFVGVVSYGGGPERPDPLPEGTGWISRFAWSDDYHRQAGNRFKKLAGILESRHGARTRWYVDTGAVLEKAWAAAAGLGFIGRNTLLISPEFGSFVFLGVVLTDIDVPNVERTCMTACGSCRACVDACPTGALDGKGTLDWSRCLAYLTVTSKSPIPEHIDLGGNLYGCDICQDACPHNRKTGIKPRPEFLPKNGLFCPSLKSVSRWCADPDTPGGFREVFDGTPVIRRGPQLLALTAERLAADAATKNHD